MVALFLLVVFIENNEDKSGVLAFKILSFYYVVCIYWHGREFKGPADEEFSDLTYCILQSPGEF